MYKLRELCKKDIHEINKWRNDPELIKYLGAPFRYINEEIDDLWYENYMKNRNTTVRLAIVDEDDKILGLASITDIDFINRNCTVHFMIGNIENRRKGLGTLAIKECLNHAFNNLNLNRVELTLLANNTVKYLYEKMGFKVEGIKKQAVYKNGEYIDVIIMAILKENYLPGGGYKKYLEINNIINYVEKNNRYFNICDIFKTFFINKIIKHISYFEMVKTI